MHIAAAWCARQLVSVVQCAGHRHQNWVLHLLAIRQVGMQCCLVAREASTGMPLELAELSSSEHTQAALQLINPMGLKRGCPIQNFFLQDGRQALVAQSSGGAKKLPERLASSST